MVNVLVGQLKHVLLATDAKLVFFLDRGIQKIKDMQEEKVVEVLSNYFQNMDEKREKSATGNLQMNLIQRVLQMYKL